MQLTTLLCSVVEPEAISSNGVIAPPAAASLIPQTLNNPVEATLSALGTYVINPPALLLRNTTPYTVPMRPPRDRSTVFPPVVYVSLAPYVTVTNACLTFEVNNDWADNVFPVTFW